MNMATNQLADIFFNTLGLTGMFLFLLAYFMLQQSRWTHDSYRYLGANFAGSVLLLISLAWDFNLSAFLLEAAWGTISGWGLWKLYKREKAA